MRLHGFLFGFPSRFDLHTTPSPLARVRHEMLIWKGYGASPHKVLSQWHPPVALDNPPKHLPLPLWSERIRSQSDSHLHVAPQYGCKGWKSLPTFGQPTLELHSVCLPSWGNTAERNHRRKAIPAKAVTIGQKHCGDYFSVSKNWKKSHFRSWNKTKTKIYLKLHVTFINYPKKTIITENGHHFHLCQISYMSFGDSF